MIKIKLRDIPIFALVSVFLALALILLFANHHIAKEIQRSNFTINVIDQQRVLSQEIAKNLLLSGIQEGVIHPNSNLVDSADLFNQTLIGLRKGGYISTHSQDSIYIDALNDDKSQKWLDEISLLWEEVYGAIHSIDVEPPPNNQKTLLNYALYGNQDILRLTDLVIDHTLHQSRRKEALYQQAQNVIFFFVCINFLALICRLFSANKNNQRFLQNLKKMVQTLPQAIIIVNSHNIILCTNKVAETLFNCTKDMMEGQPIHHFLTPPLKNGFIKVNNKALELSVSTVMTIPTKVVMYSILDVSNSLLYKQKTLYDPLTQLLNRNGLSEAYYDLPSGTQNITCLFLDLDKFKHINDKYGHAVGDQVLQIIAKRLKGCFKDNDIVSRFGGDEFIVILKETLDDEELEHLCHRVKSTVCEKIDHNDTAMTIGVSIGVYAASRHNESLEQIIDHADRAMYVQKKA